MSASWRTWFEILSKKRPLCDDIEELLKLETKLFGGLLLIINSCDILDCRFCRLGYWISFSFKWLNS